MLLMLYLASLVEMGVSNFALIWPKIVFVPTTNC